MALLDPVLVGWFCFKCRFKLPTKTFNKSVGHWIAGSCAQTFATKEFEEFGQQL